MDYYSYGQELKSARERSGLSLQAVADALHLDLRLIEAIEGEDEKALPAPAYVRGYIRAYAQLVRCEPDTLIAGYNTRVKSEPDLIASVHSAAALKQQRDTKLMWVGTGIAVSLLMIVVGGWLLIENLFLNTDETQAAPPMLADSTIEAQPFTDTLQSEPAPIAPGAGSGIPPVAAPPPAGEPGKIASAPQTETSKASESAAAVPATPAPAKASPSLPADAAVTAPAVQQPQTSPTPVQADPAPEKPVVPEKPIVTDAQTGNDRLGLALDGVSWIEVLDANGTRLVYGLFDAQTKSLSVKGQAPFDVTIGDASHVDVSVNGEFVNSEPYIRRNNTARLKVESSTQPQ